MKNIILEHSIEAEKSVLGSLLMDGKLIMDIEEILSVDDFYKQNHKAIYEAMIKLNLNSEPIDLITVSDKLRENEKMLEGMPIEYLTQIAMDVPTTANALHYAKIVLEQSKRRKLFKIGQSILNDTCSSKGIEEILEKAEKDILGINENANMDICSIEDATTSALSQLEERCQRKGQICGLPTGFYDLDFKLGGLQDGDLIIIAARPSMGKTSLAENIATFVSGVKKIPTAFFSMEMKKEKIVNRILSGSAMIDNSKIRLGTMEDSDWEKVAKVLPHLTESKLVIDDTPNIRATDIRAKCRRIKNKFNGLGLIVVDHLTEMWRPRKGNDVQEHEENVRNMKRLAREMNCPVILLQQLNRGVEHRNDKRPMLSDLKETGASEEVADVVMAIYRDEYYNPDTEKKNIAEVLILKGRDTGIGTVELAWLGQYTKFANLDRQRFK